MQRRLCGRRDRQSTQAGPHTRPSNYQPTSGGGNKLTACSERHRLNVLLGISALCRPLLSPGAQLESIVTVFCLQCSTYSLTRALAGARQPLWLLRQTKKTEIAPQIGPSSGSQGSSSPTFARSCLLFCVCLGPKQVSMEPQGNQIWN